MRGCVEDLGGRPGFDEFAEIHHGHPVGDVLDHREVVGDNEVGKPELLLEIGEQIEDPGLYGDVERGHRLVADDELGFDRERAGDADPLALAARELVRVPARVIGLQPDRLEELSNALVAVLRRNDVVNREGLADDVGDGQLRVQAGEGILKDVLNLGSQRPEFGPGALGQFGVAVGDRARSRLEQSDERPAERRLAAAALADQPERLAGANLEVDAVDRPNRFAPPEQLIENPSAVV